MGKNEPLKKAALEQAEHEEATPVEGAPLGHLWPGAKDFYETLQRLGQSSPLRGKPAGGVLPSRKDPSAR